MSCESYQAWMADAAAGGLAASRAVELEAHLGKCTRCREAFDRERALFARIDAGLAAQVAGEPSAEFALRVRRRLETEAAAEPARPFVWIPVFAGALAVLLLVAVWVRNRAPAQVDTAQRRPGTASATVEAPSRTAPDTAGAARGLPEALAVRHPSGRRAPRLEVLVAREEAQGAAWLYSAMRQRGTTLTAVLAEEAAAQAERAKPIELAALSIAPIEIPPLPKGAEAEKDQTP